MYNDNQKNIIYKRGLLPLSLFNFYDNYSFHSVDEIKVNPVGEKYKLDSISNYLSNCFKEYQNQYLMIQVLLVSPYSFFMEGKYFDIEIFNNNKSIYDQNRLLSILNTRYNLDEIDSHLKYLSSNSFEVNFTGFYSDLFIYSYKMFFVEIIESIYTSRPKVNGFYQNEFKSIKDILNKFETSKKEIVKTDFSDEKKFEMLNADIIKFNKSLDWNIKDADIIIEQLKLFSYRQNTPYHFFTIIDENIKITEGLSPETRNDFLIPLFKQVICSLFYPDVLHHSFENRRLKKKMNSFTKKYYKIKG